MRVLIIGPGYVGSYLAQALARQSHQVSALNRTGTATPELTEKGVRLLKGDITVPDSLAELPSDWDWIVNCVSSSRGTIEDYSEVYLAGARNLLKWFERTPPRKFVYTSSTGVYGQKDGSTVTEQSADLPESEAGKILLETENFFLTAARDRNFPAVVLRVSGIYGPGRGYWLKQFINGEARLDGAGDRILNMVHRDDVAGAIIAALEKGQPGRVYNVTDDEPVTQREVFEWLAEKLNKPLPPVAETEGESGRKRGITSKRVSNTRLKTELGYKFKYPTFREGFSSLLP